MKPRINFAAKGLAALKPLFEMGAYLRRSALGFELLELVNFRVSQINGCAYCLDMHSKELRAAGETEQRLYGLSAWREVPYYTDRERAALAWAEAVTAVNVPDEVYAQAREQFSEAELIDLTMSVNTINSWNRLNFAFRGEAGNYQVGRFG